MFAIHRIIRFFYKHVPTEIKSFWVVLDWSQVRLLGALFVAQRNLYFQVKSIKCWRRVFHIFVAKDSWLHCHHSIPGWFVPRYLMSVGTVRAPAESSIPPAASIQLTAHPVQALSILLGGPLASVRLHASLLYQFMNLNIPPHDTTLLLNNQLSSVKSSVFQFRVLLIFFPKGVFDANNYLSNPNPPKQSHLCSII